MKILIVDDNEGTRKLIRTVVRPLGGEIFESGNGADAIRSFMANRPDWVLMDVEMEGVDGIAAARTIVASDPGARVVMVSMHDDARLRSAAVDAGAVGYVLKEDLMVLPEMMSGFGQG